MKRLILPGGVVLLVVAAICGAVFLGRANGETSWNALDSVDALRTRFNEDLGSIRIVLLLSPT